MIQPFAGGVMISVRVVPRASRPGIAGTRDGELVVRLQAAPVEGAANDELIDRIAKILRVPRRAVSITSGERSRSKRVLVVGLDVQTAESRLNLNQSATGHVERGPVKPE